MNKGFIVNIGNPQGQAGEVRITDQESRPRRCCRPLTKFGNKGKKKINARDYSENDATMQPEGKKVNELKRIVVALGPQATAEQPLGTGV